MKKVLFVFLLFFAFAKFKLSPALATSDELYFLHTDHLDSTRAVTDKDGNVVARYDYYPYGSINNQQSTINNQVERLYTSQISDEDTGLYFYNSRYYNSALGTFISADPLQGPNRYAYVAGNPINMVDPSGNQEGIYLPVIQKNYEKLAPSAYFFWPGQEREQSGIYWSSTELKKYSNLHLEHPSLRFRVPFGLAADREIESTVMPIIEKGLLSDQPGLAFKEAAASLLEFGIEVQVADPKAYESASPFGEKLGYKIAGGYNMDLSLILLNSEGRRTPEITERDLSVLGHEARHAIFYSGFMSNARFWQSAFRSLSSGRDPLVEEDRMTEMDANLWQANLARRAGDTDWEDFKRRMLWRYAGYFMPDAQLNPIMKDWDKKRK